MKDEEAFYWLYLFIFFIKYSIMYVDTYSIVLRLSLPLACLVLALSEGEC